MCAQPFSAEFELSCTALIRSVIALHDLVSNKIEYMEHDGSGPALEKGEEKKEDKEPVDEKKSKPIKKQ